MIYHFFDELTNVVNLRSTPEGELVFLKKGDQVVSFRNICTHRGARLFSEDSPNENIVCPYHAASYDPDSGLVKASKRFDGRLACNRLLEYQKCHVALGMIAMEGSVFPNEVIDLLESCEYTDYFSLHHACNTELLIENVLEIEHVTFAHPSTFVPIGLSSRSRQETAFFDWGSILRAYDTKEPTKLVYEHIFVEPNLFVSVTNGQVGYVAYLRPVARNETDLVYRFFDGPGLKRRSRIVRSAALKEASSFTRTVLLEDKKIVEGQQFGRAFLGDTVLNGELDCRIMHHRKLRQNK